MSVLDATGPVTFCGPCRRSHPGFKAGFYCREITERVSTPRNGEICVFMLMCVHVGTFHHFINAKRNGPTGLRGQSHRLCVQHKFCNAL